MTPDSTKARILSFQSLEDGWHYGKGRGADKQAVQDAAELHQSLVWAGFDDTNAFPGAEGEILITAYRGEETFEFERSANGTWSFYHEAE